MSDERPTVRPVTLMRLVEVTHICADDPCRTSAVELTLEISHRRARETILEALRVGLLERDGNGDDDDGNDERYRTTRVGQKFLDAITREDWGTASDILATRSPHYGAFLDALDSIPESDSATLDAVLEELNTAAEFTPYTYNQTSVEVVGDWAERLGAIQRNAFTGTYYPVANESVSADFPWVLLSVFDDREETTGVQMRQRYLSIPELREFTCERITCHRSKFDDALLTLVSENVGKVELSGAPVDTGAKDAQYGVKSIHLDDGENGFVSTEQSTEQVMRGVEQHGKRYYYLAVHDRDLTFPTEHTT